MFESKSEVFFLPERMTMFSRTGKWEIMIDDFQCILNPKDTISIPINSNVNIKIDENEYCYLNCVTQI